MFPDTIKRYGKFWRNISVTGEVLRCDECKTTYIGNAIYGRNNPGGEIQRLVLCEKCSEKFDASKPFVPETPPGCKGFAFRVYEDVNVFCQNMVRVEVLWSNNSADCIELFDKRLMTTKQY